MVVASVGLFECGGDLGWVGGGIAGEKREKKTLKGKKKFSATKENWGPGSKKRGRGKRVVGDSNGDETRRKKTPNPEGKDSQRGCYLMPGFVYRKIERVGENARTLGIGGKEAWKKKKGEWRPPGWGPRIHANKGKAGSRDVGRHVRAKVNTQRGGDLGKNGEGGEDFQGASPWDETALKPPRRQAWWPKVGTIFVWEISGGGGGKTGEGEYRLHRSNHLH